MIERTILIKLNEASANQDERERVVQHALRILPLLPGVRGVTAGWPADARSRESWDVSITVRFDRAEDIDRYRENPDHRAFVDEFLKPRTAVIKAWNFEVRTGDE